MQLTPNSIHLHPTFIFMLLPNVVLHIWVHFYLIITPVKIFWLLERRGAAGRMQLAPGSMHSHHTFIIFMLHPNLILLTMFHCHLILTPVTIFGRSAGGRMQLAPGSMHSHHTFIFMLHPNLILHTMFHCHLIITPVTIFGRSAAGKMQLVPGSMHSHHTLSNPHLDFNVNSISFKLNWIELDWNWYCQCQGQCTHIIPSLTSPGPHKCESDLTSSYHLSTTVLHQDVVHLIYYKFTVHLLKVIPYCLTVDLWLDQSQSFNLI